MPQVTVTAIGFSGAKNLVQAFEHLRQLLRRGPAEALPDPLGRERPDLTDLHPGTLRQAGRGQLQRERKSGPLRLARQRDRKHRPRPLVEDIKLQTPRGPDEPDCAPGCLQDRSNGLRSSKVLAPDRREEAPSLAAGPRIAIPSTGQVHGQPFLDASRPLFSPVYSQGCGPHGAAVSSLTSWDTSNGRNYAANPSMKSLLEYTAAQCARRSASSSNFQRWMS